MRPKARDDDRPSPRAAGEGGLREATATPRYAFETLAVHAGQDNEARTGAVSFPIFQTSTYEQVAPGVTRGFSYSRTENPTRRALEECLAALEGARHGLCFASGLAAVHAVLCLLGQGDHVVAGRDLYGGSYRLFTKVFTRFGVRFTFVDATSLGEIEAAIEPRTRLLWLESPSNPLLRITDLAAAASIARGRGLRVVVDNTFATPVLQRPLDLGADLVLHSTTKYLNGHGDVIGGAVATNDGELDERLRFLQNAVGGVPAPQDCYLVLRGVKTVALRVERHCRSAEAVARLLAGHPKVRRVYYPGLPEHPGHAIARRQQSAFGGVVSFELADFEEARSFCSATRLFTLAESLGAAKSLVCHPPTMTHASVEPEVRKASGISDGLVRLSVGLENVGDLLADVEQALEIAARAGRTACARP
jgi:cystathionine gamma-lyase